MHDWSILRLLPDIGNVPLMVLRDSAAEALQQHLHKVREAGGTGVAGLWSFIFPQRDKRQAPSSESHKQQAASDERQAASFKPQASSSRITFPS